MVKPQSWSELGSSTWYQIVPSLLMEANAKTKLSRWVLHYAEFRPSGPLAYPLCRWKSWLPIFISLAPFRDISPDFFSQCLCTECGVCSCYHSQIRRSHSLSGPTNPQAFTELEFGNTMYSFSVTCKSYFLNWVFLHKVLNKSLFFSDDCRPFKSHLTDSRDGNMQKVLFHFLSSVPVREEGSQVGEFVFVRDLQGYLSSFSPNNTCKHLFSWLAMKMLIWHWFWSYMLLNESWCFCSWAMGWNARACSDAGWDESCHGACVSIAVKKSSLISQTLEMCGFWVLRQPRVSPFLILISSVFICFTKLQGTVKLIQNYFII